MLREPTGPAYGGYGVLTPSRAWKPGTPCSVRCLPDGLSRFCRGAKSTAIGDEGGQDEENDRHDGMGEFTTHEMKGSGEYHDRC